MMTKVIDLTPDAARQHFMKGSSYFNGDFPLYINFETVLTSVSAELAGGTYSSIKKSDPSKFPHVNYSFITNKDGRFSWRPYELIHPVLYVSLVNLICEPSNWALIIDRFKSFEGGVVNCCSLPVVSDNTQTDKGAQIANWWQTVEQESIKLSLQYSHLINTDVTDCYGSIYTHSISWAIHGFDEGKLGKKSKLGDTIDQIIRCGRYGQTNGISQGSTLMDFVAEMVLGYVDSLINKDLNKYDDLRILRYRDDYRIFANNDNTAEAALKCISDCLRLVGMRLSAPKTIANNNVIEGSIKPDKLAGIELQDLGTANAATIQKRLLRLHAFGRRYPNSGALRRLLAEMHEEVVQQTDKPDDLTVQIAIAGDIGLISPLAFPAIAGIISHLIWLAPENQRAGLWEQVCRKMRRVPHNGYLEIWLQRVTKPKSLGFSYLSSEPICKIVNGQTADLWSNIWISSPKMKSLLDPKNIIVANATESSEVISPTEVPLFLKNAQAY